MTKPLLLILTLQLLLDQGKAMAQNFKIGSIEVYGNREIPTSVILSKLSIKEGDSISPQKNSLNNESLALKKIRGIKQAIASATCCDTSGNAMIYIGINDSRPLMAPLINKPVKSIYLPLPIMEAYKIFDSLLEQAVQMDSAAEDDTMGYSLIKYLPAKIQQEKFLQFANSNFNILTKVLKYSNSSIDRAAAAQIIPYFHDKQKIVESLLPAVQDPADEVRNNATRALMVLATYSRAHPDQKINIPATPFTQMLNSLVWTDRNKGAGILNQLTAKRDPKLLEQLKIQCLSSLIEMAKWRDRSHASFSFFILGRIAGIGEEELALNYSSNHWPVDLERMVSIIRGK